MMMQGASSEQTEKPGRRTKLLRTAMIFSFLCNSQVCVAFSRASDEVLQACLCCYLTHRAEAAAAAAAVVAAAAPNSAFNFQQVHRRAHAWIPMTMRLLTQIYHELLSRSLHAWISGEQEGKKQILSRTAGADNKTSCCMKKGGEKSNKGRFEQREQTCRGACTVLCMAAKRFQLTKQV